MKQNQYEKRSQKLTKQDSQGRFVIDKKVEVDLSTIDKIPSREELVEQMQSHEGRQELQANLAALVYSLVWAALAEASKRYRAGEDWESLFSSVVSAANTARLSIREIENSESQLEGQSLIREIFKGTSEQDADIDKD